MKKILIAAAGVLLFSNLPGYGAWSSETVVSAGDVGNGCSLAIDRWGRANISYLDTTAGAVKYARYANGAWTVETILDTVSVYGNTSLTLDAFDKPYVVFSNTTAPELTYASRPTTSWTKETIASGSNLGNYCCVATWPATPQVTYTRPAGLIPDLYYAVKSDTTWTSERITSGGNFNSLFIDNSNRPCVVFYNNSSNSIRFARKSGTTWTVDDIAEGIDCDAVLDPDGRIHVSFAKPNNAGLVYAVSTTGGSWVFENVAAATGSPAFTNVVVDALGVVYITYFNFVNYNVYCVRKEGTTWKRERVTTGTYAGLPHSLALGTDGYPAVAYYDNNRGDLKYARYNPLNSIDLSDFVAQRRCADVNLTWRFAAGEDLAGFNLYRSSAEGGRTLVNADLVKGASPLRYVDDAAPAAATSYWLEAVPLSGPAETFGPVTAAPAGGLVAFELFQTTPNPCRGEALFSFNLTRPGAVTLAIYDLAGRRVETVAGGYLGAGRHDVRWSGDLAPGLYIYRLDGGGDSAARKMLITK